MTPQLVREIADDELAAIAAQLGDDAFTTSRYPLTRTVFEKVAALADEFADFRTLPAYAAAHDAEAAGIR